MSLNLNYYYGEEAEQFCFYRFPKVLFTDACYKAMSLDARVLYGLLLDRMGLSVRNRKMDEQGRVFIFFRLETAMEMLGVGRNKGVRLFKELEQIGLIERKRQGQGKPAIIYVKNFIPPESPLPEPPDTPDDTHGPEDRDSFPASNLDNARRGYSGTLWNQAVMLEEEDTTEPEDGMGQGDAGPESDSDIGSEGSVAEWISFPVPRNGGTKEQDVEDRTDEIQAKAGTDGRRTDIDATEQTVSASLWQRNNIAQIVLPGPGDAPEVLTSHSGKSKLPTASDFPNREVCNSRKGKSGNLKSGGPDVLERDTNNTKKNKTSFSIINLSPPTPSPPTAASAFPTFAEIRACRMTPEERRQEMDDCRECVREQIRYDILVREHPEDQRRIDGYVEVLAEALCCEDEYQRIGQQEYSSYQVRERLYQLNSDHILYVMDCMKNTTSRILNPRAYALTALFNAPLTIDQYYDSMIARDMEQESGSSYGGYYADRNACGFKYSSYPRNQYGGGSGGSGGSRYYAGRDDYGYGQRAV